LRISWLDPSVPTITHFTARIPDDLTTDSPRHHRTTAAPTGAGALTRVVLRRRAGATAAKEEAGAVAGALG
jgi:hypothetical protein